MDGTWETLRRFRRSHALRLGEAHVARELQMPSNGKREPSALVQSVGRGFLRYLRKYADGATFPELLRGADLARPIGDATGRRALDWLRDDQAAPVLYDAATRRWCLVDPEFRLPLSEPTTDDLTALVFAAALLEPVGIELLNRRIQRVVEEMDGRVRKSQGAGPSLAGAGAVKATLSTMTPVDPDILAALLRSIGVHVVRFEYLCPWHGGVRTREAEPWQVRCHDGAPYLYGYDPIDGGPKSFHVAHISDLAVLRDRSPSQPAPAVADLAAAFEAGFGIDDDRPDTAVIVIQPPLARWVAVAHWHPRQTDVWLDSSKVLQRTLPYRSCRELARLLTCLGSSLRSIEPRALREEILANASDLIERLGD